MKGYLLDTNHLSEAVLPASNLRSILYQKQRLGWRLGTCVPVVCELEAGLHGSPREKRLRRNLLHLRDQVIRLWPLDEEGSACSSTRFDGPVECFRRSI